MFLNIFKIFFILKGTVRVIVSSEPSCKKGIPDLQQYPWKLCLINWIYQWFCLLKLFILIGDFSTRVTCAFLVYKKQWRNSQKFYTFLSQENDDIFHMFDQIKVSRVPLWIGYCQLSLEVPGSLKITLTVPLIEI